MSGTRLVLSASTLALVSSFSTPSPAAPAERFFVSGPGTIRIKSIRNKHRFSGRYRRPDGRYIPAALRRIGRVFGAAPPAEIAPRLIEVLAYMRAELKGGWVIVSSGYRSPNYNKRLRKKGKTVAKASMHLYGMAADLRITGVRSKRAWEFAKQRQVGGAGYYGDRWIHIDVGPARFWTQGTANVRKGRSVHNKAVIVLPRFDIYSAGERMSLRFARVTALPIGLRPGFMLQRARVGEGDSDSGGATATQIWKDVSEVKPRLAGGSGGCAMVDRPQQLTGIRWQIPASLPPGRYRLRASFCSSDYPAMPAQVDSYPFEVRAD